MEVNSIVEALRATMDPSNANNREQAEKQLHEVHKIIGFSPLLLQVVMTEQLDMPVRQAGAIYLKNVINQSWQEKEVENPGDPVPFSVHEQDRQQIRDNIIEAIIHATGPIRSQLCVIVSHIIKCDYPGRWAVLPEKIATFIQSDNAMQWMGALMALYQMVKVYEYKRPDERKILDDAMTLMLPLLYQRITFMMQDQSEASVLLQKQILKIYYAFIQNFLPQDVLTKEIFTQWMEIIRLIVDRPVPEETSQIEEDERQELAWWKVKKWATHLLARVFERYGSPGNVTKEYNAFAEWYLKAFSGGIIAVLFKVLDQYRQKIYVAPRVMQQVLNYLNQGVSHAFSWKFMKPHFQTLIQEVLFPLMCHSDEDDDLWNADPQEYIRIKYDVFEDFLSPVIAAQTLFYSAASKRKEVLQKAMGFAMQVITQPSVNPRQKDGSLHMIGAVAEVLLKRKIYKDQAEMMLVNHVFPEFNSESGFLRARACWVLKHFCELKFKNENNLRQALELTRNALCVDKDLPVRVEAAIALQMLITEQEKAKQFIQPHIKPIVLELLNVIRETESDDLTTVMQRLVCTYVEEVTTLSVEMMSHLAQTFGQVIEADISESEEKSITALGLLNTMETILTVMEDQKELHPTLSLEEMFLTSWIMLQLEGIVLNVIGVIMQKEIMDFYEEMLSLVYSLTSSHVSVHLWQVFQMMYTMFQKDGIDYFTEMMPALHNYITVDTPAFLANPEHVQIIYNMCKTVMSADIGEDAECHAAKLLEVIILQCPGQVDHVIPSFVELALQRLTREVLTSELRTMCLQVVIAALYYNLPFLMDTLTKLQIPNVNGSLLAQFLKSWFHDVDCFVGLHDRKITVLGLCSLVNLISNNRPNEVSEVAAQIMPALLLLFSGLKRAYAAKAKEDEDSSDEDEDEEEEKDENELASDEDEVDEDGAQYLEKLEKSANAEDDDSDNEFSDDGMEETALESYQTPLDEDNCPVDEYQIFKTVLQSIQTSDPVWYQALMTPLTPEQTKELEDVFKLADQRQAAAESKRIEDAGGYIFQNTSVPQNFNFGT